MLNELNAAVNHIVSIVKACDSAADIPGDALATFAERLTQQLESRCKGRWFIDDAERGSAYRAVTWHHHASGEGADVVILSACRAVFETQAEEGEIVETSRQVLDLALRWLPTPFTLWLDPGCVSIRMGSGPGASRPVYELDSKPADRCTAPSINVIYGKSSQPHYHHTPLVTLTSTPERRPIAIVRPEARYPNAMIRPQHSRSISSSSLGGMTRSVSMSSNATSMTEASSYFSGGEESDHCPSLVSPSSSASSRCSDDAESEMNDDFSPFVGASLSYGEEEGDVTVQADGCGDTTLTLPCSSTPRAKCNYTIHDNGNVGVLGGGVKLGGGSGASKPQQAFAPRHRQNASLCHLGAFYPQYPFFTNAAYSAPMPTVPLPMPQQFAPIPYGQHGLPLVRPYYPVNYDDDETSQNGETRRRVRSRGRRSRGRGAGRAARRQAAALKAQMEGTLGLELAEKQLLDSYTL